MNCDERKDQIDLYALDALQGAECSELEAHLRSGCASCNRELRLARNLLTHLSWTLDPAAPSPSVRGRILRRIEADEPRRAGSESGHLHRWRLSDWAKVLAPVAAAAAIVYVAVTFSFQQQMARMRQEIVTLRRQVSQLRFTQQDQQLKLKTIGLPERSVIKLASASDASRGASGEVVWDPQRQTWQLSVHGLAPLPPQKVYELWYVIDGKPRPVSVFAVDPFGDGVATLPTPADRGKIAAAAITAETTPGSSAPTMPLLLKGAVAAD